ncbi:hypothetical protein [Alkalihalobacillus sp. 1P02AB]|uniref:hypothetical protein n=1 Tax=Alkalihalobacillus sp. 1P02AB TaxID=3132260 RepID=UPI0039A4A7A4
MIIQPQKNGHSPEMEKGLQQSHGMSMAEYNNSFEKRLQVEKDREKEYEMTKKMVDSLDK